MRASPRGQIEPGAGYQTLVVMLNAGFSTGMYSTIEPRYKHARYKNKFHIRPDIDHPHTK